jgi:hypothetical protein
LIVATAPEEIGLEHGADLGVVAFLDGRHIAIGRVVAEHVDPAESARLQRRRRRRSDPAW